MFTGLVEEVGKINLLEVHPKGVRIEVEAETVLQDMAIGASIAVNGCCLTVVKKTPRSFWADIVKETWQKTAFSDLKEGDLVNLERSLCVGHRLGGHFVQGHVDGTGFIRQKEKQPDHSTLVVIEAAPPLLRYVVNKGSVAVDGISLTVVECQPLWFSFAMIPHTAQATIMGRKEIGQRVNLEVDLIAKYVEKLHHR